MIGSRPGTTLWARADDEEDERGPPTMPKTKKKALRDHAEDLSSRITPAVDSAREKAAPLIADARDKAAPLIADARDKTAPLVKDARDKAGPVLNDAKDRIATDVLPVITAAVAAAGAATEDVRGETKKRGKAVAAALKGEVEAPKKKHRLRNLLVVLGLGGIAAFVAKKLSDREPTTAWQSSYTPTPAAAPTSEGGAHRADDADDAGGASPDVVAADAAATPHEATTPDNPAETVDVSKK
jgi:vacuolar-type H+-ATPase subunit H